MTEKTIHAVAEGGTWSTAAPNPHIDLDGATPANYPVAQLVSAAMATGEKGTFTTYKKGSPGIFVIHSGVVFTTGTPNILDFSSATLIATGSGGAPVNTDPVVVLALAPAVSATRAELNAAISASTIEPGRLYYVSDEQTFALGTSSTTIREYLPTTTTPADIGAATQTELNAHTTNTSNPHSVTAAQAGADPTGSAATVQGNLDAHVANVSNPHSVTAAQVGALTAVVDDTAPVLGGDLIAGGASNRTITVTDTSDAQDGFIGYATAEGGTALAHKLAANPYDPSDGGILAKAGEITLGGTSILLDRFQHTDAAGYQTLNVTQSGNVFGMSPPAPGWSDNTTSTFQHDFGNGKTQGPWVQVTGLSLNPNQDVSAGDRIDVQVTLKVENIEDKTGNIFIGFGIDGADPTSAGTSRSVPGESEVIISVAITSTTHGGITTAQSVDVFARRGASQDDAHLYLRGDLDPHEYVLSVPGGGGGGGSPTNLSTSYTGTTFTIESSTGTNALVAEAVANGDAGALSGNRARLVDASIQPGNSTIVNIAHTEQAINGGSPVGGGTSVVDLSLGTVITGTLNGAQIINFTNPPAVGYWTATIDTQSNGITWQVGGSPIDLPDGYDISGTPQRIEFSFVRTSLGTSVTERKIP